MSKRLGAFVMAAVLLLYLVLVGQRAVLFVKTGEPVAIGIGAALIVLPIIGAWALWRELLFGIRSERLSRDMERDGALPAEELPARPSGRVMRESADEVFPRYREVVENDPEDWHGWFNLALVYKAAGDGRRARSAMREAIARYRR